MSLSDKLKAKPLNYSELRRLSNYRKLYCIIKQEGIMIMMHHHCIIDVENETAEIIAERYVKENDDIDLDSVLTSFKIGEFKFTRDGVIYFVPVADAFIDSSDIEYIYMISSKYERIMLSINLFKSFEDELNELEQARIAHQKD